MGFFSSIGKVIGNIGKGVGKVVKTVAPVAAIIPGVGTAVAGAASVLGNVLDPPKQEAIIDAVADQGVVKLDKIESTIVQNNPSISSTDLQVATQQMKNAALAVTPDATIDDSKSITNVSSLDKIIQWVKSNILIVGAGAVGLFLILTNKGGKRRKSW